MAESTATDSKAMSNSDILPINAKITETRLDWSNYREWILNIEFYLDASSQMDHLTKDPPPGADEASVLWRKMDSKLCFQIRNSIGDAVLGTIGHCKTVKTILRFLEVMMTGKGNISKTHKACKGFWRSQQKGNHVQDHYLGFKKRYEEMKTLMCLDADLATRVKNLEDLACITFLESLDPTYDVVKSQILSSQQLPSLDEVYSRVTSATEDVLPAATSETSALASHGPYPHRGEVICHYCKEKGHLVKDCKSLERKKQRDHERQQAGRGRGRGRGRQGGRGGSAQAANSESNNEAPASTTTDALVTGNSSSGLATSSRKWIIDSGATDHMTGNHHLLSSFVPYAKPSSIFVANGNSLRVTGSGTVHPTPTISLTPVLDVPDLTYNLLSPTKLTRSMNCFITFFPDHCLIQDLTTKTIIGRGRESEGHYILEEEVPDPVVCSVKSAESSPFSVHCRLGHVSLSSLKRLYPQFSSVSSLDCESCQFAKHHRVHLAPRVNKRAASPFELVHSDIWGPCPVESKFGFRYFVSFVDDYSRTTWLYFMKNRSELFQRFKEFYAEIQTQFNHPFKILRSDNGREYFSDQISDFLKTKGILHQSSCVDTPAQNGIAERKNRHLLETARALMFYNKVPKPFWIDAVSTACFLINRMPTPLLNGDTPYSQLFPTAQLFPIPPKIFGCVCFVRDVRPHVTKLDPKSLKCVFLGYSRLQKGYRCYSPALRRYLVSTDVTFHESSSFFSPSESPISTDLLIYPLSVAPDPAPTPLEGYGSSDTHTSPTYTSSDDPIPPSTSSIPETTHHSPDIPNPPAVPSESSPSPDILNPPAVPSEPSHSPNIPSPPAVPSEPSPVDLPIALRKGTRSYQRPQRYANCTYPISTSLSYQKLSPPTYAFITALDSIPIPNTVRQALDHPGWRTAMEEEMMALDHAGTWSLVNLPPGKKAIGCKWVFTVKTKADGSVERLKARLVAKGYAQTYGIDYSETFSPVAKLTSVRLLISLATTSGWDLHQMDVKNAFLNGDLLEEVYMTQPPGFVAQKENGKVCFLHKSLYGLKQSPRAWFDRFSTVVKKFGMNQSKCDPSVFYQQSDAGSIFLVVYVDDIVITGNNTTGIHDLKSFLNSNFQTKDLGPLKYFLGIEVLRSKQGALLTQRKYVLELLKDTGKLGCAPSSLPLIPNPFLEYTEKLFYELPEESQKELKEHIMMAKLKPFDQPERYRSLIGKLNYLTVTRPDITYAHSVLSQFMDSPTVAQWEALEHVLNYLKGSPGRGIIYKNHGHTSIECYCDADHAGSRTTRRSTTGYCVFVGGNLVSWRSKKQTVASKSSAEAEYRAMSQSTQEIMWITHLMEELGLTITLPAKLWCDNKAALYISSNSVFHERTKHIEIDCHFVRDQIKAKVITAGHVRSDDQLADLLTKALTGIRVKDLCDKLSMIDIYAPT